MQSFDWHTHTTASDGKLDPTALIERCYEAGLSSVAVTDHDTVAGVLPATEAAQKFGIQVIPGCEFSTGFHGIPLHLLGYQFNLNDGQIQKIFDYVKVERHKWTLKTLAKLQDCGFVIPAECYRGDVKGLRNVLRAIMAKEANNAAFALAEVNTVNDFIARFLEAGGPACVARENDFPVAEAIAAIHQAKGVAVIAHPGLCFPENLRPLPGLLRTLIEFGLDGIESFHGSHTREMSQICHLCALEYGLFETGGSDFHEPGQHRGELGTWTTHGLQGHFPDWARAPASPK